MNLVEDLQHARSKTDDCFARETCYIHSHHTLQILHVTFLEGSITTLCSSLWSLSAKASCESGRSMESTSSSTGTASATRESQVQKRKPKAARAKPPPPVIRGSEGIRQSGVEKVWEGSFPFRSGSFANAGHAVMKPNRAASGDPEWRNPNVLKASSTFFATRKCPP